MAFETLLNHKCDVYHIRRADASPGYNLPSSPSFSYSNDPDIAGLTCHFGVKSATLVVMQQEPQANYEGKTKLTVPLGTDIRLNDKIINTDTGYEYTAEVPVQIRQHHMFVMLRRTTEQERL